MKNQYQLNDSELIKLKKNLKDKNWLKDDLEVSEFQLEQENELVEQQRLASVAQTQAQVHAIDQQRDSFGELDWKLVKERNQILKNLDNISWSALVKTKNNYIKALKKFVLEYNQELKNIVNENELVENLIYITVDGQNLFLNFEDDFNQLEFSMQALHPNKAISFVQRFYRTVFEQKKPTNIIPHLEQYYHRHFFLIDLGLMDRLIQDVT